MSTVDLVDTELAKNVDYGDNDADNNNNNNNTNDWADNVDYGDDDVDEGMDFDEEDGIGDLGLTDDDDDDLPPEDAMAATTKEIKYEITSSLNNVNKLGISYKLQLDTKDTPGDISDDDETAQGLKINHFQLITCKQASEYYDDQFDNKQNIDFDSAADDTLLGSGSFAKVLSARNTRTGKLVALKCMYKNLLRKQFLMKSRYNEKESDIPIMIRHTMLDAVQIELQIMMKIRHINIIHLYFIIDDPTKDSLYLAIEYSQYGQVMDFDGKLLQYIPNKRIVPQNKYILSAVNVKQAWWYNKYVNKSSNALRDTVTRFNEATAMKLFMDCVKGIKYLHSLNIIHRDIKPENLLLFGDENDAIGLMVKIADYGTAEEFGDKNEAILIDTQGTYHFMSPSAIGGSKRNAFFDDIWSLGIVLYSFIFATVPYFHPADYQLFESIQNDELIMPDNNVLSASDAVRDLIRKLLIKKDEERITLSDVETHEWYMDNNYVHPQYVLPYDVADYVGDADNINSNMHRNGNNKDLCCNVL